MGITGYCVEGLHSDCHDSNYCDCSHHLTERQTMKRSEGIAFLTRCADRNGVHWSGGYDYPAEECPTCYGTNDAGHLACFSRYGRTANECAPVAWRVAYLVAKESGHEVTEDDLDYAMGLVVNESDDVAYIVNTYGHGHYR